MNLIERIEKSNIQHFDSLSNSLRNSENIGVDLIRHGYQCRCSNAINSALRNRNLFDIERNDLIFEISEIINITLENHFARKNSTTVWRRDWPITSSKSEDLKIIHWFEKNIGKILLFPSFLSSYSEFKRLPTKERYFEIITHSQISNAFDISSLNSNHPEAEILFKTNSKLKIVDVNRKNLSIKLHETEEQEDFKVTENAAFHCHSIRK